MIPLSPQDKYPLMQTYPSGEPAFQLDEFDCGYCYYISGRMAVHVNKVSSYQRSFHFYNDDEKKSLLATIDEHGVGHAERPKGMKVLLTKNGGILLNSDNKIVREWSWATISVGEDIDEPINIQLNHCLLLTVYNKQKIVVQFTPHPACVKEFICGQQLKRYDTYLDRSVRQVEGIGRGKLTLTDALPSLVQRQKKVEEDALEKRRIQNPRSQDFTYSSLKEMIASLESTFNGYEGCNVSPSVGGNWKQTSLEETIRNVPILCPNGTEVGSAPTLFRSTIKPNDATTSLERLKDSKSGKWLGSLELRYKILDENPILKREGPLTKASGRYSRGLAPGGNTGYQSSNNNTARLPQVAGQNLSDYIKDKKYLDKLIIAACLRPDDSLSRDVESTLEKIYHQIIMKDDNFDNLFPIRVIEYRTLIPQNNRYLQIYDVGSFFNGDLVKVSSFGGRQLRIIPTTKNSHLSHVMDDLPKVLIMENDVKRQIRIEKCLRREKFQWDLAINSQQAISHMTLILSSTIIDSSNHSSSLNKNCRSSTNKYNIIILNDHIDQVEMQAMAQYLRTTDSALRASSSNSRPTLICVIVDSPVIEVRFQSNLCTNCRSVQNTRRKCIENISKQSNYAQACPHCGIIIADDLSSIISPVFANIAQVAIFKQIKGPTLHRIAERWYLSNTTKGTGKNSQVDDSTTKGCLSGQKIGNTTSTHIGLTSELFFKTMEEAWGSAHRGNFLTQENACSMALSALEIISRE